MSCALFSKMFHNLPHKTRSPNRPIRCLFKCPLLDLYNMSICPKPLLLVFTGLGSIPICRMYHLFACFPGYFESLLTKQKGRAVDKDAVP